MYRHPKSFESERADIGLDAFLKSLKDDFEQSVTWLGPNVYLRGQNILYINAELQDNYVPVAYMGGGEMVDLRPNDNVPSILFFRVNGPSETNFNISNRGKNRRSPILETRELSLVFWCDYEKITPPYKKDYPFIEPIKREFLKVLKRHVMSIDAIFDDNIDEVYSGYDLTVNILDRNPYSAAYNRQPRNDRAQLSKWPNGYLRIDFTARYYIEGIC